MSAVFLLCQCYTEEVFISAQIETGSIVGETKQIKDKLLDFQLSAASCVHGACEVPRLNSDGISLFVKEKS